MKCLPKYFKNHQEICGIERTNNKRSVAKSSRDQFTGLAMEKTDGRYSSESGYSNVDSAGKKIHRPS